MKLSRRSFLKSAVGGAASLIIPIKLKGKKAEQEIKEIKKINLIEDKIFFVSKYHSDIYKFRLPKRRYRPAWYQIKHVGDSLHGDIAAYWLIVNIPDNNYPNKNLFSIRIYKEFGLKDDFVQPTREEIEDFLIKTQSKFNRSLGCEININIRDYVLDNRLKKQECKICQK